MKITNEKLITIRTLAINYINAEKENSKFKYALTKLVKRSDKALEPFFEKRGDILVDCASVDEKGNLIETESGKYSFTPAKKKEFAAKTKELFPLEVEIEPYFCTEVPKELDQSMIEEFVGIVIKEEK